MMLPVPVAGRDGSDSLCCRLECRPSSLFLKRLFVSKCSLLAIDGIMFSSISKVTLWALTSCICVNESGMAVLTTICTVESAALFWTLFSSDIWMFEEKSMSWTLSSSLLMLMWGSSTSLKPWVWSPASWYVLSGGFLFSRWSWG